MSNEFKDLSFTQHVARLLFALGITAVVAILSIFAMRWIFGIA